MTQRCRILFGRRQVLGRPAGISSGGPEAGIPVVMPGGNMRTLHRGSPMRTVCQGTGISPSWPRILYLLPPTNKVCLEPSDGSWQDSKFHPNPRWRETSFHLGHDLSSPEDQAGAPFQSRSVGSLQGPCWDPARPSHGLLQLGLVLSLRAAVLGAAQAPTPTFPRCSVLSVERRRLGMKCAWCGGD